MWPSVIQPMLFRITLGTRDLKHSMHTNNDSVSDMGRAPPGHTSSPWCVRLKMQNSGGTYQTLYRQNTKLNKLTLQSRYILHQGWFSVPKFGPLGHTFLCACLAKNDTNDTFQAFVKYLLFCCIFSLTHQEEEVSQVGYSPCRSQS